MRVEALVLPDLGDQRGGYRLVAPAATRGTMVTRLANVRVGARMLTMALTEVVATPGGAPSTGDEEFGRLVEVATKKLAS